MRGFETRASVDAALPSQVDRGVIPLTKHKLQAGRRRADVEDDDALDLDTWRELRARAELGDFEIVGESDCREPVGVVLQPAGVCELEVGMG